MKFIDETKLYVRSGNGGPGCVSFRRERFIERGGPDGGDGGKGGSVIFKADPGKRTLFDLRRQKQIRAQNGTPGMGKLRHGKNGEHCIVPVPPGTLIMDAETGEVLADITTTNQEFVAARGGMGGRGNKRFASSTNRAPRHAQTGTPGEELTLRLELKLLADVGLVGLPNAGKSTLVSRLSSARPKIADYPFTTLNPSLGMVQPDFGEPFAVADIPGLIEGAHQGVGLGIQFLKHIERTGILVHLVDVSAIDPDDPLGSYHLINEELRQYSAALGRKPQVLVLNKMDLTGSDEKIQAFVKALGHDDVITISAATGKGTQKLKQILAEKLGKTDG